VPFELKHCHGGELSHIISLVDCLVLWNEFRVNSTLNIEESDERYLHLLFQHAVFFFFFFGGGGSRGCWVFTFYTLSFAFRIILKGPCFICSDNFTQNFKVDSLF
jgi:hypothetical protein